MKDDARSSQRERKEEILGVFARRAAAEARVAALPTAPLPPPPAAEPLSIAPFLARAKELAAANGARLVVVAAPLDAQASPEARQRRQIGDAEAAALDVLSAEIATAARSAGAVGVDATPALKQVGEAAFLHDGHLSARGHEAVAQAIAAALREPGSS
jgi:hypothetical protein